MSGILLADHRPYAARSEAHGQARGLYSSGISPEAHGQARGQYASEIPPEVHGPAYASGNPPEAPGQARGQYTTSGIPPMANQEHSQYHHQHLPREVLSKLAGNFSATITLLLSIAKYREHTWRLVKTKYRFKNSNPLLVHY